jgi:hypothetical protein
MYGAKVTFFNGKDRRLLLQGLPHGSFRRLSYSIAESFPLWTDPPSNLVDKGVGIFIAEQTTDAVPLSAFRKRMGHLNFESCKSLAKECDIHLTNTHQALTCDSCIHGKGHAQKKTPTLYLLKRKADAKLFIEKDIAMAEAHTGLKVLCYCTETAASSRTPNSPSHSPAGASNKSSLRPINQIRTALSKGLIGQFGVSHEQFSTAANSRRSSEERSSRLLSSSGNVHHTPPSKVSRPSKYGTATSRTSHTSDTSAAEPTNSFPRPSSRRNSMALEPRDWRNSTGQKRSSLTKTFA